MVSIDNLFQFNRLEEDRLSLIITKVYQVTFVGERYSQASVTYDRDDERYCFGSYECNKK